MSDQSELTRLRTRAAQMTTTNPAFLGSALARYQQVEGLNSEGIAQLLRIAPDRLDALALCRLPRADHFAEDVDAIANRFEADPGALARMLREVAAVEALSGNTPTEWLQAARDTADLDRRCEKHDD